MKYPVFHGEVNLSYVFDEAEVPSDKLVIVFQALKCPGGLKATADFRVFLMNLTKVHRLFIVDDLFECSSAPYICVNKELVIENTFIGLVEKLKAEYGIHDILMFGASAGANAAIYYGFKYNFYICALGPSYLYTLPKDPYLLTVHEKATGSRDEAGLDYLNELIRGTVLKSAHKFSKRIFVTCGSLERNYTNFLVLKNDCETNGIKFEFQNVEIASHIFAIGHFLHVAIAKIYEFLFGYTENSKYISYAGELKYLALHLFKERERLQQMIADDMLSLENKINFNIHFPFIFPVQEIGNEADSLLTNTFLTDPGSKSMTFDTMEQYWAIAAPTDWFSKQQLELRPVSILCAAFRRSGETKFLAKASEIIEFGLKKLFVSPNNNFLTAWGTSDLRLLRLVECMSICFEVGFQIPPITILKRFLSKISFGRESEWELLSAQKRNEQVLLTYAVLYKYHTRWRRKRVVGLRTLWKFLRRLCSPRLRKINGVGRDCAVAALKCLLARIAIYYPSYGLPDTGGTESVLDEYHTYLVTILHYYRANGLPLDLPEWKEFCRKADEIRLAAEHLVLPNGLNLQIGNTGAVKQTYCRYIPHSFLPKNHSLKLLKSKMACVSVNGLYEMLPAAKHDDELSFTFMYDGIQIVYDSGGRAVDKKAAQYLRSVYAHSGLFADDGKYFCDLFDFVSAVEEFDEYTVVHSRNDGYDGVALKRTLIWLKDNTIILLDSGRSKDGQPHTFTQHFIFTNFEAMTNSDERGFDAVLAEGYGMRFKVRQYGDLPDKVSVFSGTDSPDGSVYFGPDERLQRQRFAYEITAREADYATVLLANAAKGREEYSEVTVAKTDGRYTVTAVSEKKELRFMVNETAPDSARAL
jgi:hypothetical protein